MKGEQAAVFGPSSQYHSRFNAPRSYGDHIWTRKSTIYVFSCCPWSGVYVWRLIHSVRGWDLFLPMELMAQTNHVVWQNQTQGATCQVLYSLWHYFQTDEACTAKWAHTRSCLFQKWGVNWKETKFFFFFPITIKFVKILTRIKCINTACTCLHSVMKVLKIYFKCILH